MPQERMNGYVNTHGIKVGFYYVFEHASSQQSNLIRKICQTMNIEIPVFRTDSMIRIKSNQVDR